MNDVDMVDRAQYGCWASLTTKPETADVDRIPVAREVVEDRAPVRRYGLKPYRYYRQRRNTVMIRAPKRFLDQVLWPQFSELDQALQAYLHHVTLRVIRDEVFADASEAQEIAEALPPN